MRPKSNVRSEARIPTGKLPALLLFDQRVASAWVMDLSLGGARLRIEEGPPIGARAEINFSGGRRYVIRATACVVDRDDESVRVCFIGLTEDHGERLKQLIADHIFNDQIKPWQLVTPTAAHV